MCIIPYKLDDKDYNAKTRAKSTRSILKSYFHVCVLDFVSVYIFLLTIPFLTYKTLLLFIDVKILMLLELAN